MKGVNQPGSELSRFTRSSGIKSGRNPLADLHNTQDRQLAVSLPQAGGLQAVKRQLTQSVRAQAGC